MFFFLFFLKPTWNKAKLRANALMSKLGLSTVKQCKCLWCVKLRWCQKELIPKSSGQFSNKPIEHCSPHRDYFYFACCTSCAHCARVEKAMPFNRCCTGNHFLMKTTPKKKTAKNMCVCLCKAIYIFFYFFLKLLYPFRKFGMILKLVQQRVKQRTACWLKPTSTDGQVTCQSNAVQWEVSDTLSRWIMLAFFSPPWKYIVWKFYQKSVVSQVSYSLCFSVTSHQYLFKLWQLFILATTPNVSEKPWCHQF